MKICDHDLFDISAVLVRIRYAPLDSFNEIIMNKILKILSTPDSDNSFNFNKIRIALSEIPYIDKGKWEFVFHNNFYVHTNILKDENIYRLLITICTEIINVIKKGNQTQIDNLVDAVHCLPDILAENRFLIPKSYWKSHIQYYRDKWDKNFLKIEQKLLT